MTPLIDYPDSDEETTQSGSTETPTLPPLPASFHTLYATSVRTSTVDDPSLHSGRTRQIPHKDGIWPSHLQLEWHPSPQHQALLTNLLRRIQSVAEDGPNLISLFLSPLGAPAPLHISLSKTLPIQTKQREPFLKLLESRIRDLHVARLEIKLNGGLHFARNQDGSRWFLVVKPSTVGSGIEELGKLLVACNGVVKDSDVDATGLYDGLAGAEGLHFSIAWCLGSGLQKDDRFVGGNRLRQESIPISNAVLREAWESAAGKEVSSITISMDRVMARIGNTIHSIEL
jgi:U6 snRNA phosphodiesterase